MESNIEWLLTLYQMSPLSWSYEWNLFGLSPYDLHKKERLI